MIVCHVGDGRWGGELPRIASVKANILVATVFTWKVSVDKQQKHVNVYDSKNSWKGRTGNEVHFHSK